MNPNVNWNYKKVPNKSRYRVNSEVCNIPYVSICVGGVNYQLLVYTSYAFFMKRFQIFIKKDIFAKLASCFLRKMTKNRILLVFN